MDDTGVLLEFQIHTLPDSLFSENHEQNSTVSLPQYLNAGLEGAKWNKNCVLTNLLANVY